MSKMKYIKNFAQYIKDFREYMKKGGVRYTSITYTAESNTLEGKKIIVTGGGSGIGRAIAEKCVAKGGKVVIVGRTAEKLNAVKEKLGHNCHVLVADVSAVNEKTDIIEQAENLFGSTPDCLVNNAGVYARQEGIQCGEVEYDVVMNTNLKGVYFLTQSFAKKCIKNNKKGNVVMVSSMDAYVLGSRVYGLSKGALNYLTSGLAKELIGNGIRVNGVAPGPTASDINGWDPEGNIYINHRRGHRILLPEEIAEVCVFLLGDQSKVITGVTIPCDKGEFMR